MASARIESRLAHEAGRARLLHEAVEAVHFGGRHATSEARQPVVAPALVLVLDGSGLFDSSSMSPCSSIRRIEL